MLHRVKAGGGRRRVTVALAVVVATGAGAATSFALVAADAAAAPAAPTIVSYTPPPSVLAGLSNQQTLSTQGARLADGSCQLAGSLSLTAAQTAIEQVATSVNTDTCQVTVLQGTPSASLLATQEVQPSGGTATSQGATSPTVVNGRLNRTRKPRAHAASTYYAAGYLDTWVNDPLNIKVNEVKVNTTFDYNYSCVVNPSGEGVYNYWYTPSGWYKTADNWNQGLNCSNSWSSGYARYENDVFPACLPYDPFYGGCSTTYNRSTIFGHPNGDLVAQYNTSFGSNPGDQLLGAYQALVRTA